MFESKDAIRKQKSLQIFEYTDNTVLITFKHSY